MDGRHASKTDALILAKTWSVQAASMGNASTLSQSACASMTLTARKAGLVLDSSAWICAWLPHAHLDKTATGAHAQKLKQNDRLLFILATKL